MHFDVTVIAAIAIQLRGGNFSVLLMASNNRQSTACSQKHKRGVIHLLWLASLREILTYYHRRFWRCLLCGSYRLIAEAECLMECSCMAWSRYSPISYLVFCYQKIIMLVKVLVVRMRVWQPRAQQRKGSVFGDSQEFMQNY